MSEENNGADAPPATATPETKLPPAIVTGKGREEVKADKRIYLPCPCGAIPEQLLLEVNQESKVGRVTCGNCGSWGVDFLRGHAREQEDILDKGQAAWDAAPRPSAS